MPNPTEFATCRLTSDLKVKIEKLAKAQKWTFSQTLRVLIEEALHARGSKVKGATA
jgi:hypothetical protein